jgi:hypothetical protein
MLWHIGSWRPAIHNTAMVEFSDEAIRFSSCKAVIPCVVFSVIRFQVGKRYRGGNKDATRNVPRDPLVFDDEGSNSQRFTQYLNMIPV